MWGFSDEIFHDIEVHEQNRPFFSGRTGVCVGIML